jgi:hypothetical protein
MMLSGPLSEKNGFHNAGLQTFVGEGWAKPNQESVSFRLHGFSKVLL